MIDTMSTGGPESAFVRSFDQPPEMEAALSLQCDLRDILTLALLAADLLRKHADPTVVKRAETVVSAIMRVVERVETATLVKD